MKDYSETRKKDRAEMMVAVVALIQQWGWTIIRQENEPDCFLGTRACIVSFETEKGLQLSVDFDGETCQPNTHVLSWHISTDKKWNTVKLAHGVFGSINEFHFHKATDVAYGFYSLIAILADRFHKIKNGEAFQ